MRCSKHPEHEAAGICSYSGKPYCAEELVEVDGKLYAKDNLSRVLNEIKEQATKQHNNVPMVFMNAGGGGGASASSAAAASGYAVGHARSRRSKTTALLLSCLVLFGLGGLHRFYTGHILIGILQFCTLGGFFIWQIIDLITINSGTYRDADGYLLS